MNPYDKYPPTNLYTILGEDYDMVLAGYPVWRGFIAAAGSGIWVEFIPELNVTKRMITLPRKKKSNQKSLFSQDSDLQSRATENPEFVINEFLKTVPEEILELTSKYTDSHWSLISAVKLIGNDFQMLMKTNPALSYIIVNLGKLNPFFEYLSNIDLLQKLIRTKRKEILVLGGLPESKNMIKLLSKIDPSILNIELFMQLKGVQKRKDKTAERIIEVLTFAKQINSRLIHLITVNNNLLKVLSNKVIFQLTEDKMYTRKSNIIMSMLDEGKELKLLIPVIDNLDKLDKIKEKFDEQVFRKRFELEIFPNPPYTGNDYINPIKTEKELTSWSKKQQNCANGFANSIRSGSSYLYKVIVDDEEATLEISLLRNGETEIGQLSGFKNKSVSVNLKETVTKWFEESKKTII